MPRMSIRQFRAALEDSAHVDGATRAYRAITRHRRAAAGARQGDWIPWGAAAAERKGDWGPWAGGANQPGAAGRVGRLVRAAGQHRHHLTHRHAGARDLRRRGFRIHRRSNMNRTTIQQFRAALTGGADETLAMRTYRAITRAPRAALSRAAAEWMPWEGAANSAGWAEWPAAASTVQPPARVAGWGDWSGPPARVARA